MSTFLQVLRLALWTSPLQRALTGIGVIFAAADSLGVLWPPVLGRGFTNATVASLLMGGAYWRVASAPRIVRLAPHGRARLLRGALGVVLLVALLWNLPEWFYHLTLNVDPRYLPSFAWHLVAIAESVLVASVAVMGLFIASRSPLAALLVLIGLVFPGAVFTLFDVDLWRQLRPGPAEFRLIGLIALIWIPFAIWYLRARRVSFPRWLAGGGEDVLATTLVSSTRPKSRSEALQRQLLGGTTIIRFGLQWFVVLGLLLGLQWGIVSAGEPGDPALVARVMYASLCICPVVTTVASFAAIRRSRSLWLLAASTRGEFFARIERILIRLNLATALGFAIWLAVLWFMQWWRPGATEDQLARAFFHMMSLWLLGTFAIYTQLAGWPKWPVAMIAAGVLILMWWLTTLPVTTPREEAVTGLSATILLIAAVVTGIVLRWQAQRRWCEGDFPRPVTSVASGT